MTKLITKENKESVRAFLDSLVNETKKADSFALVKIFEEVSGYKAKMWGESIIGFGKYHYKSARSSQEGDWMMTGFSPRKAAIALYIMSGFDKHEELLKKIGKFKKSSGCCLYVKRLEDIDVSILKKLIKESCREVAMTYSA